ncbi:hypothetical protein GCM10011412_29080 [Maribacter cobaltidurans]|nr:hypothetical protein GCM10011412_29080 [Maribacter cobaltidurans]
MEHALQAFITHKLRGDNLSLWIEEALGYGTALTAGKLFFPDNLLAESAKELGK